MQLEKGQNETSVLEKPAPIPVPQNTAETKPWELSKEDKNFFDAKFEALSYFNNKLLASKENSYQKFYEENTKLNKNVSELGVAKPEDVLAVKEKLATLEQQKAEAVNSGKEKMEKVEQNENMGMQKQGDMTADLKPNSENANPNNTATEKPEENIKEKVIEVGKEVIKDAAILSNFVPMGGAVKKVLDVAKLAGVGLAIASSPHEAPAQNVDTQLNNLKEQAKEISVENQNPQTKEALEFKDPSKESVPPPPIIVHDANDPRLKEYQDSLNLFNKSEEWKKNLESLKGYEQITGSSGNPVLFDKTDTEQFLSYENFSDTTSDPRKIFNGGHDLYITQIKKTPTEVTWTQRIGPPNLNKFNTYTIKKEPTHLTNEYRNLELWGKPTEELEELGWKKTECEGCTLTERSPVYQKPQQEVRYEQEVHDTKFFGWNDNNNVVGYYNYGDGKGQREVTVDDVRKMSEEEFKKMFPNEYVPNLRESTIKNYDERKALEKKWDEEKVVPTPPTSTDIAKQEPKK